MLWGQYALFLYIRIQDDLLDRQREDLRWIFVADRFLLESLESFHRCAALGGGFWTFYWACVRETVEGILRVRRLEMRPGTFRARHLSLHASVSAIFKLGAAAVCHLHGRIGAMRWVAAVQDQHAVMSQILDDLEDLPQDLRDDRFTWVANTLLGARPGEHIGEREQARRLSDGLLRPERWGAIVGGLRRAAEAAAAAMPRSAPRTVRTLVRGLQTRVGGIERQLHQARVRWVLGDAAGPTPRVRQGQPST